MNTIAKNTHKAPEYTYHLLRGALEKFQKNISELNNSQYQQAIIIADKTFSLESRVLSTPEAHDIQIPESKLNAAIQEVEGRYTDHNSFLMDLNNNNLNEEILRRSLYRELIFDVVIDRITDKIPEVNDVDIQIFYQFHKKHFTKPEKRKSCHILITINPDFAENDRISAQLRINAIAEKLQKNPAYFKALAKKYSECPTAMKSGELGKIIQGTLFTELDAELFNMKEGEISKVIETEMGFHILLCEKIYKPVTISFSQAKNRIKHIIQERQRKAFQKAWLEKTKDKVNT